MPPAFRSTDIQQQPGSRFADHIIHKANALPAVLTNNARRLWRECQHDGAAPQFDETVTVQAQASEVMPPPPSPPTVEANGAAPRIRRRRRLAARVQQEGAFEDVAPRIERDRKKRILMLISDTGGGHRASAQALESMLEQVAPGATDVSIVDIWTDYCPWPYNTFVSSYQYMAKHSWMWGMSWHWSAIYPNMALLNILSKARCEAAFRRCFDDVQPDLIVSVHPLTQAIPLHILANKGEGGKGPFNNILPFPSLPSLPGRGGGGGERYSKGGGRKVPFATVVTDLGGAHPFWFDKRTDACFVPSDAVRRVAQRRGLKGDQIRQYGLPVRPSFWQTPRPRQQLFNELGLEADRKTVLVVGGGDGVGSLGKIVEATASQLSASCPGKAQVVAVCGKNQQLRDKLAAMEFGDVNVQICGFVKQMSDYMEIADVMITKAGPGTIAEATIRGLPTMLSSFLPGQEAGNVPFVIQSGFGEYAKDPKQIARKVTTWIEDPRKLAAMQDAARAAAAPAATQEIAVDLLALLEDGS